MSSENHVRVIDPLDDPAWDAKIAEFPDASFFHGAAWARVLHHTYGFAPMYLVATTNGRWRGVLPIMEVDSWLTGRRGISLPFTDHCSPLGLDPEVFGELNRAAIALATERQWRHWELRSSTAAPISAAFHGHSIALDQPIAALFARCDGAVRRAVRKAQSEEVMVSFSQSLDSIRSFRDLLCQTRRRHGLPPQPLHFFDNIQGHVLQPGKGSVVLAHVQGKPVAGAVFFHFGRAAMFKYGASDTAFQHLRPNNLVLWRAIEWHARSGFAHLDLGRTALDNEGLRRFKLSWGATERRIEYARFDRHAAAFVGAKDSLPGWSTQLFRILPPSLARLAGAVAYKHVA